MVMVVGVMPGALDLRAAPPADPVVPPVAPPPVVVPEDLELLELHPAASSAAVPRAARHLPSRRGICFLPFGVAFPPAAAGRRQLATHIWTQIRMDDRCCRGAIGARRPLQGQRRVHRWRPAGT